MTNELQKLTTMHTALVLELAPLAQRVADVLALTEALGHQINAASTLSSADENGIAPVEQWPQIGETVEIGFVNRGDQLALRAVVEIPCHEHTSESAENDFLALHPRAENVRTALVEYPDLPPLCYDWNKVQWPPIPAGARVRLDHGEFYTKTGVVTEDVGPYCKIDVGGELTELGKRWLAVIETPRIDFAQTFDRGPEPVLELAYHRPSTIPPPVETNEIGAVVHSAEFAPDHTDLAAMLVTTSLSDEPPGVELPAAKPKRAKTEYTAHEWAMSPHFLHLMKRQHPFNTWTAEKQNTKRDEFVASVPPDEKMNRWGQRFAKFCGVAQ